MEGAEEEEEEASEGRALHVPIVEEDEGEVMEAAPAASSASAAAMAEDAGAPAAAQASEVLVVDGSPTPSTVDDLLRAAIAKVPLPTSRKPTLLHADSLGNHPLQRVSAMFREWWVREWCARKNGGQPIGGSLEAQRALSITGLKDPVDERKVTLHSGFWKQIIDESALQGAPKQKNSFDCGVYTVRYAESILEMLRGPWRERCFGKGKSAAIRWPEGIAKFAQHDIDDTRGLIRAVIARCRQEDAFVALSMPRAGLDGGDAVLMALAVKLLDIPEDDEVQVEGTKKSSPGWMVCCALGKALEYQSAVAESAGAGGAAGGAKRRDDLTPIDDGTEARGIKKLRGDKD
jgi:hypothetical protein